MEELVILAATDPVHSVTAVMNLATLYKTAPTRFLPQEHHITKTGLIQGHDTPTPKGHTSPTVGTDMGDISTNHNHTTNPTVARAAAVPEGTHCPPPYSHHNGLCCPSADGCPHCHLCHDTPHRHSHTPSHTHHFSHQNHSCHYSKGQGQSCSNKLTPHGMGNTAIQESQATPKTFNPPYIPPFQDSSSRTPHQILPQIRTMTLIL